jgi:hypothetical protein
VTAPGRHQHTAPGASSQRQAPAAAEPQDHPGRQPTFVLELWASPQLRNRDPNRAPSLADVLGRQPAADKDREPDLEPEIEP